MKLHRGENQELEKEMFLEWLFFLVPETFAIRRNQGVDNQPSVLLGPIFKNNP